MDKEEVIQILDSISKIFPEILVIEIDHLKKITEERGPKNKSSGNKLEGRIKRIYDGSGLIQRCPKCGRWIIDNFCIVHGDVEGIWDFRIKAEFENGEEKITLILKRNVAEEITNITLEEARKLGPVDTLKKIEEALLEKKFIVEGIKLDRRTLLVKKIREM